MLNHKQRQTGSKYIALRTRLLHQFPKGITAKAHFGQTVDAGAHQEVCLQLFGEAEHFVDVTFRISILPGKRCTHHSIPDGIAGLLAGFQRQQLSLPRQTGAEAAERAVAAQDPMTRYENEQRIRAAGGPGGAHGPGTFHLPGQPRVAARFARRDAAQRRPDLPLKRSPGPQSDRDPKADFLAGSVTLELGGEPSNKQRGHRTASTGAAGTVQR